MSDYLKYNGLKKTVRNRIKTWGGAWWGAWIFAKLLRRNKHTHYVVVPPGIGDTICALAFLRAYREKEKLSHVTLVGGANTTKQLCAFYGDLVDDLIILSRNADLSLLYFPGTYFGQWLCAYSCRPRITIAHYLCNIPQRNVWDNSYFCLQDFIKCMSYQIGPDALPEHPHVPQVDVSKLIRRYGVEKDKTVFLNPYANAVKLDVKNLFKHIAEALIERGYRVLTLTAHEAQHPVEGTQALLCDLSEAFRLAEYGGTLIGLRSGFLDLMVFAKCRMIPIDDDAYGRKEFFKLEKWGVNKDCHTVTYKTEEQALAEILEKMEIFAGGESC